MGSALKHTFSSSVQHRTPWTKFAFALSNNLIARSWKRVHLRKRTLKPNLRRKVGSVIVAASQTLNGNRNAMGAETRGLRRTLSLPQKILSRDHTSFCTILTKSFANTPATILKLKKAS